MSLEINKPLKAEMYGNRSLGNPNQILGKTNPGFGLY